MNASVLDDLAGQMWILLAVLYSSAGVILAITGYMLGSWLRGRAGRAGRGQRRRHS